MKHMKHTRVIGLAVIAGAAVLGWFGWQEYQSLGSKFSSALTGSPTDSSMWMLSLAAALAAGGAWLVVKGR